MRPVISLVINWTIRIFIGCSVFSFIRLMIGPRGADRLIALSLITALGLGTLVLFGVQEDRGIYLDVALIYDILGFLGILGIASFIRENRG